MRFAYSALGIFLASFIAPLSLSVAQESGTPPLPDFPAALRRDRPVEDIQQAIVYTMNELVTSDEELELARKTGSDMLIRGWFKWGGASNYSPYAPLVPKAHAMGALFGGGITCSALYHGENGLNRETSARHGHARCGRPTDRCLGREELSARHAFESRLSRISSIVVQATNRRRRRLSLHG